MTSSSASSVRSMKSPSTLALASPDDVNLLVVFVEGAVEEGAPSFLAANCAKNDAAEGEDSLLPLAAPPPPNLERFVSGEFLKMLGVDEREEEDDEDEAALLPVMPPLLARSRSTSDELVAAAFGATVDADRPSPG